MAGDPQEQSADGCSPVSVDAALKLVEGEQNEAKVLGATLLLRHHNKLLLNVKGYSERSRLRVALGAHFLCRLLQSSVPLQRLALGLMAVLLAGTEEEAQQAALGLLEVVPFLVACASKSEISESQAEFWGPEEFCETLGLLKRLLDLLPPTEAKSLVQGCEEVLALLLPSQKCATFLAKEEVATGALGLTELLFARDLNGEENPDKDLSALLETVILEPCFRGTSCQTAALQLLASRRPSMQRLDEVISCSLGSGATAQRALLQLSAGLLAARGTQMRPNNKAEGLSRLKTLLVLAAGELRMALEGYGSKEGLAAACMLLEEALVALGKEAETLEAGNLEEVSECLLELHRALRDIFDYCADLPVTTAAPEELAMVARVVAAFQLEDPQRFSSEFLRSIETFCSLEAAEFKVLLPSLQELQDWHCTRAFAKVLEVARWGLEHGFEPEGQEVWRQCAMMLAEVALDAAVYLPDVFIPEPDEETSDQAVAVSGSAPPEFVLACSILSGIRLPRPVPAADANHQGAQRLSRWSRRLWWAGQHSAIRKNGDGSDCRHLWELTLLSASLLTSVPCETVQKEWPAEGADMWSALAGCILSETEVEATTGRLAVRLAGFSLDRHQAWPQASGAMSDAEVAALAMQLDELDGFADPSLLAAQFQEYDEKFTMDDAEKWNGHGDLMHSPFSREHLSLEKMDPVTLYSVGHGDMLEKDFWEMLQCHSIRVLYDIRPTDYRGEFHSRHQRFSIASLRGQWQGDLKATDMEVIPSPQLRCPDATICPDSSYSSLFMGGYNLKIHVSSSQPGVQLELPQVMRGFGSDPPTVETAAVKQVGAALAAFLNAHFSETCEADVNFGLACVHGQAVYGTCVCLTGYAGVNCDNCADGYLLVNGQCMRLVVLSPPDGVTQKYGSAFTTTSSGKRYLYTRKFTTQLSECGAGCLPLNISLRVRCDSDQCHNDLNDASYTVGVALYDATGQRLCDGTTGQRAPQAETDWWLQVPLQGCPLLQSTQTQHDSVYLSMWTSKWLKLRWEQEPALSARSRGLQYKTDLYQQDPSLQSSENLVDALPPSQLPSWIDVPCVSPNCANEEGCDCISGCTCRSWTTSGSSNFYGLMATLSMQPN